MPAIVAYRTRWLLGGGSVLLPLIMFSCLWVVTMIAPVQVPGGSIYVCLLVAVIGSAFVIFTTPISAPRRAGLFLGALLVIGLQVLALGWLAMQFSGLEGIQ